jgi:hypothetical protein
MANDVSAKDVVAQGGGWGNFPECSLRRLLPNGPSQGGSPLYKTILHEMTHNGETYSWPPWNGPEYGYGPPVCKEGKYEANLPAARSYEESTGYLASCRDILRLWSFV